MKKIFPAISYIAAALAVIGCAKTEQTGPNDAYQRYFESWMQVNHPDATASGLGIYIIEDNPGNGAEVGDKVQGTATPDEMCTKGDLLIVIDPEHFAGSMQFKFFVDQFIREIREENGVIPGDREVENIRNNKENGINIDSTLYDQLTDIAQEKGLDIESYFEE
jgi:hypothetical protein